SCCGNILWFEKCNTSECAAGGHRPTRSDAAKHCRLCDKEKSKQGAPFWDSPMFPTTSSHISHCLAPEVSNPYRKWHQQSTSSMRNTERCTPKFARKSTVEVHQPLVETYYGTTSTSNLYLSRKIYRSLRKKFTLSIPGPGRILKLILRLQEECDKQVKIILNELWRSRQLERLASLVRDRNKPANSAKPDPKDLDQLLGELTIIQSRYHLYLKFLRRKVAFGGLALDKEVRALVSYFSTATSWSVRDKLARLTQVATVLNLEQVNEINEYWGSSPVPWRLSLQEIKKLLKLSLRQNNLKPRLAFRHCRFGCKMSKSASLKMKRVDQYIDQFQNIYQQLEGLDSRRVMSTPQQTLCDLFVEDLLRTGLKLRPFAKQPLAKIDELTSGCARSRRRWLAAWMFEEKLKELYGNFIAAVNNVAKDTVDTNRIKAVTILNKMLISHPEQEQVRGITFGPISGKVLPPCHVHQFDLQIFIKGHQSGTRQGDSQTIVPEETIKYDGDPLSDFTLSRFLERFVFKNPKHASHDEQKGPDPLLASRKYYQPSGARNLNVTSSNYLQQDENDIPVDERFLYRYLKEKFELRKQAGEDDDDDNDSVASEQFEELLDKMMGGKKKDLDFMEEIGDTLQKKTKGKDKSEDSDDNEEADENSEDDAAAELDELADMSDIDVDDGEDDDEVLDFDEDEAGGGFDGDIDFSAAFDEEMTGRSKKRKVSSTCPSLLQHRTCYLDWEPRNQVHQRKLYKVQPLLLEFPASNPLNIKPIAQRGKRREILLN
ncbi:unnamed protein product, partial [Nesidiocoris tenuis]